MDDLELSSDDKDGLAKKKNGKGCSPISRQEKLYGNIDKSEGEFKNK